MKTAPKLSAILIFGSTIAYCGLLSAQCATCGPDYNKVDRPKTEVQRVTDYDKPVQKDPVGNALIGGGVSGVIKGSVGAAATSVVSGTTFNATKQKFKGPSKKRINSAPRASDTIRGPSSSQPASQGVK